MPNDTTSVQCQTCNGRGYIHALIRRRSGCQPGTIVCHECGGVGHINKTAREKEWKRIGSSLRRTRDRLDISIREVARACKVSAGEWSDVEEGRADPDGIVTAWNHYIATHQERARG